MDLRKTIGIEWSVKMGKKKKENWSPSSHSVKWDENERKFREQQSGPKKYEKHEWGHQMGERKKKHWWSK